jgi:hypothetical protein
MPNRNSSDDNTPVDGLESLICRYEALDDDISAMIAENQPFVDQWLSMLAGAKLEIMLGSPEETSRCLSDSNPDLRRAALHLLDSHAGLLKKTALQIEHMAVADPDCKVRELAIEELGSAYARTQDVRVGHLLARKVIDQSLEEPERVAAFRALVIVTGVAKSADKGVQIVFPQSLDDIAWQFVNGFLAD